MLAPYAALTVGWIFRGRLAAPPRVPRGYSVEARGRDITGARANPDLMRAGKV